MKQMNRKIKPTVYKILREDEYARGNDNYLIAKVSLELEPNLAGTTFENLMFSKTSHESVTRARRNFFKEYPELKPKKVTEAREKEMQEYVLNYSHIPRKE